MNELDLVFWAEEEHEQSEKTLKLLLCCNATQQEDWLKSKLPDFTEAGRAKNVTELRKVLKDHDEIDLAIIMRKTGQIGVEKPEEMAKVIREHSPDAQILVIAGTKDERGIQIIEKSQELDCRTLAAVGSPIKAGDILREVEELAEIARRRKDAEVSVKKTKQEPTIRLVRVEAAKGGCGQTTAIALLALMLREKGEPVKILEPSGGCRYLASPELQELLLDDERSLPDEGWFLYEQQEDRELPLTLKGEVKEYHLLVLDPSPEALERAKQRIQEDTIVVVNRAEPSIMPNEIYAGELKRKPDVIVPYKPAPYLTMDWEPVFADWQPLLDRLMERG